MGIRLLNTAASTPVTYTFRADGIGKSRCILLRPVRRMSETVMTGVFLQDSSRRVDTVGVEKDTRRSCRLRITVHIAAWRVEPRVRSGLVRHQDSVQLGWQCSRMAKKRPCQGCSDGKAAGWQSSVTVWGGQVGSGRAR